MIDLFYQYFTISNRHITVLISLVYQNFYGNSSGGGLAVLDKGLDAASLKPEMCLLAYWSQLPLQ